MKRQLAAVALCGLAALPVRAQAQTWPTRPVTITVPFPPGLALDLVTRLVGVKLADALGQPIVIDNRSGANGMIGSELVARAAPDGYSLLGATAGTHVTSLFLQKNLSYDPVRDFTPIVAAVEPVTCLAVSSALPVNSVTELIAYAKARPGELSFGSSGVGSVFHLLGELFNQIAGVKIAHVPYRGVAPAIQDVAGGHIPIAFTAVANALPAMQDGRVKILAVLEPTRYSELPDIPSITELLPGFKKPSSWFGYFGPAGMDRKIVTRLNAELVKGLNAPDVAGKLADNGYAVIGGTPDEFAALMRDGIDRYGAIIKTIGLKPE